MEHPVVGKIASGLFIISAFSGEEKEAYLGSWVQQASFSPMRLTVAIKPGRSAFDLIQKAGFFTVNVVGHQNGGVMKPFWGAYKPGDNPLDKVAHKIEQGALVVEGTMGWILCRLVTVLEVGDHHLLLGEVVAEEMTLPEDKPMTHLRKKGSEY